MKMKRRYKYKKIFVIIFFIVVLIMVDMIITINYVGNKITPIVDDLVIKITNDSINNLLFKLVNKDVMGNIDVDEIIKLNVNKNDEIVSVDYKVDNMYLYLSDTVNQIYSSIIGLDIRHEYYNSDDKVFRVPIGIVSNNVLLSHIGPKIPVKVEVLDNVDIGYKTKVNDYGINNSLVELYLVVEVKNNMINPFYKETFGNKYEFLIASRLVVGKVPSYYNGGYEKSSAIVSS